MQKIRTFALLAATLTLAACSSGNNTEIAKSQATSNLRISMSAVEGSSLAGISYSFTPEELVVNFESVVGHGQYVEFSIPAGITPVGQHWTGDEQAISLVLHNSEVVQVGVAPLAAYQGNAVAVNIQLGYGIHTLSGAPTADNNELVDLTIDSLGDGSSRLEWSEVNRGDYDFNSQVNVADITPIALNFQVAAPVADPGSTAFWVDGDNNGEVNLADISQIAINFQNNIESYKVVAPDGTPVIASRADSLIRDGLPPQYNVTLPGNPYGGWQVAPVSTEGDEGLVTDVEATDPDLLVDLSIAGLELYDLDGSGSFGAAGEGRVMSYLVELDPLRRILPGEDPDMAEIGTSFNLATPSLKLYETPRDRQLALLVLYIPTIDLVNGLPRGLGGLPGQDIWAYDPVVTVVPFNLHGLDLNAHATVDLHFSPGPFDGYYSDITTAGLGLHPGLIKLDNADGVLNRDSNGNLDFADEARMLDERRWGVTPVRIEQLGQLDEYANGENIPFVLNAIVNGYNQGGGEIGLKETMVTFDGQGPPVELGEIALSFSEYATFASKLFGFEDESPIDPSIIEFGVELEITGYKLVDDLGGLEAVFWGDHIVKIIR